VFTVLFSFTENIAVLVQGLLGESLHTRALIH